MLLRTSRGTIVLSVLLVAWASAPAGADHAPAEDDWTLPVWAQNAPNSGFYSEEVDAGAGIHTRVVDLTWRQLEPTEDTFSTTTTDSVYGMSFASYEDQLAGSDPFWLRIWISGVDWAPQWVQDACGVSAVGTGYEGDDHLPIWNDCLWSHAADLYREVLVRQELRLDPRLRFVYVPGAFTWCEFDLDIVAEAADNGLVDQQTFDAWFATAMSDLVTIMNGDNEAQYDDRAHKLVYTGEDYPFGPFGAADDLLAKQAVDAGMGIRNGITELFNFHLDELPAYGLSIAQTGHVVVDEDRISQLTRRIVGTENECYNACGYNTSSPYYAVKMSNLKALQMRVNWLYVVPGDSYLSEYADHWAWVRASLGQSPERSPDAWVALRESEDLYWQDDDAVDWPARPLVRNIERWLVQRDQEPDAVTRRGSETWDGELDPDNGQSWEGRRTNLATGDTTMYFDLDDRWVSSSPSPAFMDVKVTYREAGDARWRLEFLANEGLVNTPDVIVGSTGEWKTWGTRLVRPLFADGLSGNDFRIVNQGPEDIEVRFVRIVRVDPPVVAPVSGAWTAALVAIIGALMVLGTRRRFAPCVLLVIALMPSVADAQQPPPRIGHVVHYYPDTVGRDRDKIAGLFQAWIDAHVAPAIGHPVKLHYFARYGDTEAFVDKLLEQNQYPLWMNVPPAMALERRQDWGLLVGACAENSDGSLYHTISVVSRLNGSIAALEDLRGARVLAPEYWGRNVERFEQSVLAGRVTLAEIGQVELSPSSISALTGVFYRQADAAFISSRVIGALRERSAPIWRQMRVVHESEPLPVALVVYFPALAESVHKTLLDVALNLQNTEEGRVWLDYVRFKRLLECDWGDVFPELVAGAGP